MNKFSFKFLWKKRKRKFSKITNQNFRKKVFLKKKKEFFLFSRMFCFIILLLLIYSRTTKSKRRMFCKRILEETKRNLKIVRSRVKLGKLNFFTNEIHHSETKPFSFFSNLCFCFDQSEQSKKWNVTKNTNYQKAKFVTKKEEKISGQKCPTQSS